MYIVYRKRDAITLFLHQYGYLTVIKYMNDYILWLAVLK